MNSIQKKELNLKQLLIGCSKLDNMSDPQGLINEETKALLTALIEKTKSKLKKEKKIETQKEIKIIKKEKFQEKVKPLQEKSKEIFPFKIHEEGKDFDDVWKIYILSFPKEEQRTREAQIEFFKDPNYSIYGFKNTDKLTVGFMTTWMLTDQYLFIAYFAIHPSIQNLIF
jgi:tRNA 2-selenouridine synthase SelU